MAVTNEQKIDFLLKKIGFTKTKTGSTVGSGSISGTGKQPFAEAIPSPLIIANSALWNESGSIPTTPPGSDTAQVKVYLAGTSGLRMTADATSSGQRAYIAYTTYNDTSSARLTNWIDTQFGASYLIKVYKGDPNSGGVALSAAGSGSNDGWFFDYSAGVLNFNDTSVPSGVTDTNIYIVGYRYIGSTGAPTPTGGGNFTYNDLVVSRNFQVAGLSTFNGLVDINAGGQANTFKVEDLTSGRVVLAGTGGELEDNTNLTFNGSTLTVGGNLSAVDATLSGNVSAVDATFSGNVSIAGTLTYEDAKNVDSVGLITARSGIRVTGGVIEAQAGENKIPSLYAAMGNLPSAGSYHGMFAHVHATARGYFAHAGNWLELVNKETNGVVGTGTETYNIGNLVSVSSTATSLNVTGVTTAVTVDINGDLDVDGHTNLDNVNITGISTIIDLDVDGHTNLDNVSVAGVSTFSGNINLPDSVSAVFGTDDDGSIKHTGTNLQIFETTGNIQITNYADDKDVSIKTDNGSGGTANYFLADGSTGQALLYHYGNEKLTTTSSGISVTGTVVADGADINGDLDVDGHTNLDNVSIAGVTTFTGNIGGTATFQDIDVDGHTNLDNVSIAGVTTGTTINATTFVGNGDFVELDVDGHTNLDNVSIAGVTTFSGKIGVHDGTTGGNGQYLRATGTGVTWGSFPTMRTSQTFTASAGQTTFSFTYNVGFLDVYVNGVKLTSSEFTANSGTQVVLSVGSFVGDIVELVSYFTTSYAAGEPGITELVQDPTPQLGGNLDLFNKTVEGTGNVNMTGVVTATKFVGDGSSLSGIVASGSGVVVKNSGSLVGTAGTIDFGSNLSVTPVSAGIVTITGSAGGGSGISTISGVVNIVNDLDVDGHTNLDNVSIAGVVTATTFVGAVNGNVTGNATGLSGTPNISVGTISGSTGTFSGAIDANGDLDVDGHTELDNVNIAGVVTTSDIRSNALTLKNAAGSASYAVFSNGGSALLKHNNTDRLETSASGVTVTGTVAATAYTGDGSQLTGIVAGITTISGVVNVANDLDVDGHTNLDNVSVAGVTTFASAIDLNADLDVDGHTNLDNVTIAGVCTATNFVGDGSGLTNVIGSGSGVVVKDSGSTVGTAGTINFASGLDVTDISAGIVTVSTATTSITDGNSKAFVNNVSSSNGNGSFEVLLNDFTYSGTKEALNMHQPSDGYARVDLFHGSTPQTIEINAKTVYSGTARHRLKFESTNSGYGGELDFITPTGSWKFYSKYQNTNKNVIDFNFNSIGIGNALFYPTTNNVTDLGTSSYKFRELHITNVNAGVVTATAFHGDGSNLTGISGGGGTNVGITTNLSGSFTASAGTAATINTLTGYSANDLVVEYTIYIKNGSDFQTQKLLAMRDGTTIHSTQFAVMFSSSLLVQCDATISSGNILLRATPETGVSGSTTYKIKREVM